MNFGTLFLVLIATVSALGHNSSLAVRNLRFDLAARQNHRRLVLRALKKIKRFPPYRRQVALKKLREIVDGFNYIYEEEPAEEEIRQENRRNRFAKYHS